METAGIKNDQSKVCLFYVNFNVKMKYNGN
jgi:hypothetical protein